MTDQANSSDKGMVQPNLFSGANEHPDFSTPARFITDAEQDNLLVTILSMKSIKGIGFKTLCSLFDAGLIPHLFEGNVEGLRTRLPLMSDQSRIELARKLHANKNLFLDNGFVARDELRRQHIWFTVKGHRSYPKSLLRMPDPPRWLFGQGNLDCISSNSIVSVVGTREASPRGQRFAYQCASELVRRNIVVLSGLAKGIDEHAHIGAIEHYGQTIGVIGHGINYFDTTAEHPLWKKIVDSDGSIISEYMPGDSPSRKSFLRRNELQVALSRAVIPVESPSLESGTGATIRRALSIGTPVVGVFPSDGDGESALHATRNNLLALQIPVFVVSHGNSKEFWEYLNKLLPEHNWHPNPKPRQDRFFRSIEQQVVTGKNVVDLDSDAVNRFTERLKKKLEE